ncbi:MAG: hypothetical protein ACKOA4_05905 [Haliscomenobacter sp.]
MRNHKILLLLLVLLVFVLEVQAQCPMCRIAAESNLENGGSQGKGLNLGILYMLATPYLLVGTIGFIWWRNRRRQIEE